MGAAASGGLFGKSAAPTGGFGQGGAGGGGGFPSPSGTAGAPQSRGFPSVHPGAPGGAAPASAVPPPAAVPAQSKDYSDAATLPADASAAFAAPEFELGKVPELPPPQAVC